MTGTWRACLLALNLSTFLPVVSAAQTIDFDGRGDPITDDLIRRTLAEGAALVVTRDTLLGRADTIQGRVIVAGATLRLEGVIRGELFGVDANLFLRPGSRVENGVTNLGGAFWPTETAVVQGEVRDMPDAPYDAVATPEGARIVGLRRSHVFATDGLSGLRPPSYDRVDGLGLSVGARYYLVLLGSVEPAVRAHVGYAFRREAGFGAFEIALLGTNADFVVRAEHATATQDAWIRGDVLNTFGYFLLGEDHRDYWRADRGRAEIAWRAREDITTTLGFQLENARSLEGGDPWTLITVPDSVRPNPGIDDGRITSVDIGVGVLRQDPLYELTALASIELAGEVAGGDFDFGRFLLDAHLQLPAFSNHTLGLRLHGQGPLPGTDSLPRQRWSFIGGQGTLETLDIAAFRGDRVALFRTTYRIPIDAVHIPGLGFPALEFVYAAGSAWLHGSDAELRHAFGSRLRFPLLYAYAFLDPDAGDTRFGVGVNVRPRYPWEDRR